MDKLLIGTKEIGHVDETTTQPESSDQNDEQIKEKRKIDSTEEWKVSVGMPGLPVRQLGPSAPS